MISSDRISVLFDLQQLALNTEDTNNLLNSLLSQAFSRINDLGLSYEFIITVCFNDQNSIDKIITVPQISSSVDVSFITKTWSSFERELLWGPIILPATNFGVPPFDWPDLKSVVITPVLIAHQFKGMVMFASKREGVEITKDELEFLELLTDLMSLGYRLQDTQTNLTNISQEVYKMNLKLHELDKLKDDFVSIASHELRTPMTAIRSYAWMALYKPDIPLSDKMKKWLTRTFQSTERLINLVNDMLNVSRIESGRIEINPKGFLMSQLVSEVLEEVKVKAEEKKIKLTMLDSKVPQVFADPDKIHQVLLNLVGNALKFTPASGTITLSFASDGKVVETLVKDNGVGLSPHDVSRLFQKFGRLDSSYTAISTSGGTGLGLYICKSLIELMKGKIWATSEGTGKGTTFIFSLPVATSEILKEAEKYQVKAKGEVKGLEPVSI